jgi:3-hydroxyisobutyrate dehydrogenase-like beta-hydroxyacid dehydrogenase
VSYLDATVGGSSKQTLTGEVIVMVGGDEAAFGDCQEIFAAYARATFYLGPAGCGARMKLVVNLALGLNRAVLDEALSFARALDIQLESALVVLRSGPAYSTAMDIKGLKMVREDFSVEARSSQHLKDVRLILDAARMAGAHVPLTELHRRLLEAAESRGYGDADNSAVLKAFEASPEE